MNFDGSLSVLVYKQSIILVAYLFSPVSSVDVSSVLHIDVVKTLGGSESEVVVTWLCGLPEVSNRGVHESGHLLSIHD